MPFRLVDTGGIFGHTEDPLHDLVVEHGKRAILQADLVIFVVDGREGRVPGDDEIAAEIRPLVQGIQISPAGDSIESALSIMEAVVA
jgi:GTP-binding protein